jgi:predicted nucleotidyltransferase
LNNDQYLTEIVSNNTKTTNEDSTEYEIANSTLYKEIVNWARNELNNVYLSGSYAKGTNVIGSSDLDLFVSLKPNLTLRDYYEDLFSYLNRKYFTRRQNVSIGIDMQGYHFDITPGRWQNQENDHSIFVRRKKTWTKTNVFLHINLIKLSNRINEIKLLKIWRNRHKIDFPSFYLELSVIRALKDNFSISITDNFITLLTYLRDNIVETQIYDPANTNNLVSDELSYSEKKIISNKAHSCLNGRWGDAIW